MDLTEYSERYASAIRRCVIWQVVLGVLAGLALDQGQTARAFGVALVSHWTVILIILHRRPLNPSRIDLVIVQYGILPLLFLVMALGPTFLRLIGTPPSMIPS